MKAITKEALLEALKLRDTGERPVFRECEFKDMDLSGADLHNMDFTLSSFQNVNLEYVNLKNSSVEMHCLTGIPAWCGFSECEYEDSSIS